MNAPPRYSLSCGPPASERTIWPLNMPLVKLSRRDTLTLEHALLSILVLGGKGSGKTSASMRAFRRAFLRNGFGFLVLCCKPTAAAEFEELAVECGRAHDVRRFSISNGSAFNPIDYQSRLQGDRMGIVDGLAAQFYQLYEVVSRGAGQSSDDFFSSANKQLLRKAFFIQMLGVNGIDIADTLRIVQSVPQSRGEVDDERLWKTSDCLRLLEAAAMNTPAGREEEMNRARRYFLSELPGLSGPTRSSITQTASTFLDSYLSYPLYGLFGGGTSISPGDVLAGRIVIVDVSVKSFPAPIGQIAALIWKTATQKAIERQLEAFKGSVDEIRPTVIDMDEAQCFVSSDDADFLATSRSARGLMLMASQSIPSFHAAVGADGRAKAKVEEILANALVRVGHASLCDQTNKWFASSLGEVLVRMNNGGTNEGTSSSEGSNWNEGLSSSTGTSHSVSTGQSFSASGKGGMGSINLGQMPSSMTGESYTHGINRSVTNGTSSTLGRSSSKGGSLGTSANRGSQQGWSESYQLDIRPREFVELKRGGKRNKGEVTAIVVIGGELFSNGRRWLKVSFLQKGWETRTDQTSLIPPFLRLLLALICGLLFCIFVSSLLDSDRRGLFVLLALVFGAGGWKFRQLMRGKGAE